MNYDAIRLEFQQLRHEPRGGLGLAGLEGAPLNRRAKACERARWSVIAVPGAPTEKVNGGR